MSARSRSLALILAMAMIVVLSVTTTGSFATKKSGLVSDSAGLGNLDSRAGSIQPTAQQRAAAERLGAEVTWNEFGTPRSMIRYGGYLSTSVRGTSAASAARRWVDANRTLFRLQSARTLDVVKVSPLSGSSGRVVLFRQRAGDFRLAEGGLLTIGAVRSQQGT